MTVSAGEKVITVVMPCLNEAETLGICVRKALRAIRESGVTGEVIVADNGSVDGSQEIALREGARVVAGQDSRLWSCFDGRDRSRIEPLRVDGGRR